MAKKVKTPEEVQAAIEKKVAKRTIFFGTFRKALAFFLAIALAFALAQIAYTPVSVQSSDSKKTEAGKEAAVDLADGQETVKEGEVGTDAEGNEFVGLSKGEAVKLLNDATAAAEKAGYDWTRKCYYTKAVDVGKATSTLNSIIQGVDKNASLDSVVGNFLDITGESEPLKATKQKGSSAAPEGMKDKFLLKGMSLTEADVMNFVQTENTYKFQINACDNPQKDGGNALHHATNDFITEQEVSDGVKDALGSASNALSVTGADVSFSQIVICAKIVDGKLVELTLNYSMDVKALNLKATFVPITGTGAGVVEEAYTNFVY